MSCLITDYRISTIVYNETFHTFFTIHFSLLVKLLEVSEDILQFSSFLFGLFFCFDFFL